MKKPENLEFKLLMKNIKKNKNIIENRTKTREELRAKKEEYNKKLEEIRMKNELNLQNKKIGFYKRKMSRDIKDLQKRYQILKPEIDDNNLYNNDYILNQKVGLNINAFSGIHRHHVNEMKNNFYKKNKNLKFVQNNFLDNLPNNVIEKDNININKNKINSVIKNKKNISNVPNSKISGNKEIKENKYKYFKDDKLGGNNINNICFDGNFFDNKMIK